MKKIIALILKNVITMFVRCTVYEIWFFSFCHFGVHQPFCYVVCEHLHNVDEGASYLPLFCYRPVSLGGICFSNFATCLNIWIFKAIFVVVRYLKRQGKDLKMWILSPAQLCVYFFLELSFSIFEPLFFNWIQLHQVLG